MVKAVAFKVQAIPTNENKNLFSFEEDMAGALLVRLYCITTADKLRDPLIYTKTRKIEALGMLPSPLIPLKEKSVYRFSRCKDSWQWQAKNINSLSGPWQEREPSRWPKWEGREADWTSTKRMVNFGGVLGACCRTTYCCETDTCSKYPFQSTINDFQRRRHRPACTSLVLIPDKDVRETELIPSARR